MTISLSGPSPERVWAEEDTETGEHTVITENGLTIGNFLPSNDGGFICSSEYNNDSITATNEIEAVQKLYKAYRDAVAEAVDRR